MCPSDTLPEEFQLAVSKGFGVFALSIGNGTNEPIQVGNAFLAVSRYNANLTNSTSESTFKLFLSFNMSSLLCSSAEDSHALQEYINTYSNATDYFRNDGRRLVSASAGETCTFGQDSVDDGWKFVMNSGNGSSIPNIQLIRG